MVKGWKIKALTPNGHIILNNNLDKDKSVDIIINEKDIMTAEFRLKPINRDVILLMNAKLEQVEEKIIEGICLAMRPCEINKDFEVEVLI